MLRRDIAATLACRRHSQSTPPSASQRIDGLQHGDLTAVARVVETLERTRRPDAVPYFSAASN